MAEDEKHENNGNGPKREARGAGRRVYYVSRSLLDKLLCTTADKMITLKVYPLMVRAKWQADYWSVRGATRPPLSILFLLVPLHPDGSFLFSITCTHKTHVASVFLTL